MLQNHFVPILLFLSNFIKLISKILVMVVLPFKPALEQFSLVTSTTMTTSPAIPTINLSDPDAKQLIVKASEELGFFKVINHGVPMDFISTLESKATKFFSLPLAEKEKAGPSNPFGYGNKRIGRNGDVGWVEYLLMSTKLNLDNGENPERFRCAMNEYVSAVKKMSCELLELMADGLGIQPRDVFSRLLMDEESDSLFRINHYPPCPELHALNNKNLVGFGEHTDPQIISVLRANDTSGYEIFLRDGTWVSVAPDENSFFINIGDSLQVMTNGRFRSVRHRVLANSCKSRLSMVYFGGPPMGEKIAPLSSLMGADQPSLYKEFTWFEYITSAFKKPLADNRLVVFEKIIA